MNIHLKEVSSDIFFMLAGLVGLWLGTELVIKGAVNIANYYQLSQVFVGIAIIALGTDLPETVIAINAALQSALQDVETSGIIVGNAIGSSFSQISAVLGTAGLLGYLTLTRRHLYVDGLMLIGSVLLLFLVGFDQEINRIEGIVLIVIYLIYYLTIFHQEQLKEKIKKKFGSNIRKDILLLVLGVVIVIFTSELVVDNALKLTKNFNVRQSFIGIIIIGLGTSLPELFISLNAVRKKAKGLSVGNLIGSNIFDLLIPVGVGAFISELQFEKKLLWFDLPFLFILSLTVLLFFSKKKGLQRVEAVILIGLFMLYAALKIVGL